MDKVRVIKRADGGVSIIHDVNGTGFDKATPKDAEYYDIDKSEIPINRTDRNAWEFDSTDKKVKVNATKKAQLDADKADKEADKVALQELIAEQKAKKAQK